MSYKEKSEEEQKQLREFVSNSLDRYSTYRDNKESMAYAGLALFIGAAASALVSKDWPPPWGQHREGLIVSAFTVLWVLVLSYLRYQLRRRRWAALRVAGCDWLLARWLPDSPEPPRPQPSPTPSCLRRLVDLVWPMDHTVAALDPTLKVYVDEIENSWIDAGVRGTDALKHERLIYLAGWIGYIGVVLRTYFV